MSTEGSQGQHGCNAHVSILLDVSFKAITACVHSTISQASVAECRGPTNCKDGVNDLLASHGSHVCQAEHT